MRRPLLLATALTCVLAVPATARADDRVIAPGTSAAGVDLSGQTIDSAVAALETALRAKVDAPVTVTGAGRRFTLTTKQAKVRFDALRTAKRAYYAGRDHGPGQVVPLALTHSRKAVATFTGRVAAKVSKAPRDAVLRLTVRHVSVRPGRSGRATDRRALGRRIDRALGDPHRRRALRAATHRDRPDVTAAELRRANRTVITVDRRTLRLRLFKRFRVAKRYDVAIGRAGFETPGGVFHIQSRQVNPVWHVPNRPWAGSLAGQTVPGGAPNNPLRARWLGVSGSVGIHGTAEELSVGSRASHGCIRMRVADVIDLYPRVPLGTTVLIR